MRIISILITLFILSAGSVQGYHLQPDTIVISSPDNTIRVSVFIKNGMAYYKAAQRNQILINSSALGLSFRNIPGSGKCHIAKITHSAAVDSFRIVAGKIREGKIQYNQSLITIAGTRKDVEIQVEFKVTNHGFAFRYKIPKKHKTDSLAIMNEKTEFCFGKINPISYPMYLPSYWTDHEGTYFKQELENIASDSLIGLPLLLEYKNGTKVMITEAALLNYPGMYLKHAKENVLYTALTPTLSRKRVWPIVMPSDEVVGSAVKARVVLPFESPWRVILIENDFNGLLNSNLIYSLNRPSNMSDISWIKPGKVYWTWWSGGNYMRDIDLLDSKMDTRTLKHYIDFASENKFEYFLIDDGWAPIVADYDSSSTAFQPFAELDVTRTLPSIDIKEVVAYANQRNVNVMLWMSATSLRKHLDKAFPLYEQWGIKGIKVDHFYGDDQETVRFVERLLNSAGEHHLMVDLHCTGQPTGLNRTYPHLLTSEGVRGLEHNKFNYSISPQHNVTIPFTRMIVGPMDYTPGAFRNVRPADFKVSYSKASAIGTRASQLAMYVIYESPLQMFSEHPNAARNEPGLEWISVVPTTWDEVKYISGTPGEFVVLARRKGNTWYIAGLNNASPRQVSFNLDFIKGEYECSLYQDEMGKDQKRFKHSLQVIKAPAVFNIDMEEGGGFVMKLVP